jgi:hypothetical protein
MAGPALRYFLPRTAHPVRPQLAVTHLEFSRGSICRQTGRARALCSSPGKTICLFSSPGDPHKPPRFPHPNQQTYNTISTTSTHQHVACRMFRLRESVESRRNSYIGSDFRDEDIGAFFAQWQKFVKRSEKTQLSLEVLPNSCCEMAHARNLKLKAALSSVKARNAVGSELRVGFA